MRIDLLWISYVCNMVYASEEFLFGGNGVDSESVNEESSVLEEVIFDSDGLDKEVYVQENSEEITEWVGQKVEHLVGSVRDEYGCITSANYIWCGVQKKCLLQFVECVQVNTSMDTDGSEFGTSYKDDELGEFDEDGCSLSAGYVWCEKRNECVRFWELERGWDDECIVESITFEAVSGSTSSSDDVSNSSTDYANELLGGEYDVDGCLPSAGYSWCENRNECVRSWELEGKWDDECRVESSSHKEVFSWCRFLIGALIFSMIVLLCLIMVRRKRLRLGKRAVLVQMIADNSCFLSYENNCNFQDTVGVREKMYKDTPRGCDFTNFV